MFPEKMYSRILNSTACDVHLLMKMKAMSRRHAVVVNFFFIIISKNIETSKKFTPAHVRCSASQGLGLQCDSTLCTSLVIFRQQFSNLIMPCLYFFQLQCLSIIASLENI